VLFPTHIVAAYLLSLRWNSSPAWAVAGAALPDMIDKPIAMSGLYDLYHSIGHSGLVCLAVTLVGLGVLALGRGPTLRQVGPALWIGWASHLALDAVHMLFNGRPGDARFLLWPVVEHSPAVRLPPLEFAAHYVGTPAFYVELFVWIVLLAVVVRRVRAGDGALTGARRP